MEALTKYTNKAITNHSMSPCSAYMCVDEPKVRLVMALSTKQGTKVLSKVRKYEIYYCGTYYWCIAVVYATIWIAHNKSFPENEHDISHDKQTGESTYWYHTLAMPWQSFPRTWRVIKWCVRTPCTPVRWYQSVCDISEVEPNIILLTEPEESYTRP